MIKIILADDHNIVRNGIKNLLEKENDIRIIGEATNGQEVLDMLNNGLIPDIVLADMNMPVLGGIELTQQLQRVSGLIKVLLLTMHDHENYVIKAFNAGVMGYLFKNISATELLFAIQQVHNAKKYMCVELTQRLLTRMINIPTMTIEDKPIDIDFSKRELEILELIAEGYTNQEIADKLFTSRRTVEGHRQSLIDKTGVRNTPALVKLAVKSGIIN
ncbi:response regulator [Mucilaginibacter sp. HD30]